MASATKAAAAVGMSPVRVYVGSHVDSATKSVERGEGSQGKILRSAAKFADLSGEADEQEDAEALRMGAEELLRLARTIDPESATKSDTGDRDAFGRRLGGVETATKTEDRLERDLLGRKGSKLLDRQGRTGERDIEKSSRLDEDRGRDIQGKRLGK